VDTVFLARRSVRMQRLGLEPIISWQVAAADCRWRQSPDAAEIMDTPASGQLGGTFERQPASCAAALAVLDIIEGKSECSREHSG
jgi:hypothetical protein